MTPEERIELHDQWLLSMESNHSQFAAHLAALERDMERFRDEAREQMSEIREVLLTVVQHQVNLSSNVASLAEQLRALKEVVEQYIRFRGNGRQEN